MSKNQSYTVGVNEDVDDPIEGVDCQLCENVVGDGEEADAPWNEILFESEDFVSIPSVGALVAGYTLVLPKSHVICSGALKQRDLDSYWQFTQRVRERIEQSYGKTIVFEHGPATPNTDVGCGVDHAHLHIVPVEGPILELAEQNNPVPINWREIESFRKISELHEAGKEYLFYQDSSGPQLVGTSGEIRSQLFRRAIADHEGLSDKFDWNDYPMVDNVEATVEGIGKEDERMDLGVVKNR